MIDRIHRSAHLDSTGRYRYALWRSWPLPRLFRDAPEARASVCWIMLNPSTADGEVDDPTIRRCIGFSRGWGYGALAVVNLFALRATDPDDLLLVVDPVGPENDSAIIREVAGAALVVAAWGHLDDWNRGRGDQVRELLANLRRGALPLYHLGLTKQGFPHHPLYLPADLQPSRWEAPA